MDSRLAAPYASLRVGRIAAAVWLGWEAAERSAAQPVTIDLELRFATPPDACRSDELAGTADYGALVGRIVERATRSEFRLLEHLAWVLSETLRAELPTGVSLALTVTKRPPPPIDAVQGGASFRLGDWPAGPTDG